MFGLRSDPTRTSLSGHDGAIALTKIRGLHWLGNVTYQETSPGYESNDLGSLSSAARRAL
ncbi:MAG: hypothetical protein ACREMA_03015 [Longimicrobiales bacterium]